MDHQEIIRLLWHILDHMHDQNVLLVQIADAVGNDPGLQAAAVALRNKTDALQAALAAAPK